MVEIQRQTNSEKFEISEFRNSILGLKKSRKCRPRHRIPKKNCYFDQGCLWGQHTRYLLNPDDFCFWWVPPDRLIWCALAHETSDLKKKLMTSFLLWCLFLLFHFLIELHRCHSFTCWGDLDCGFGSFWCGLGRCPGSGLGRCLERCGFGDCFDCSYLT
jgi:hypothetical protein